MTLSILLFNAFYLFYNYYLCHFDRFDNKGSKETVCIQLTETNKVWPIIRKGEIYELVPAERKAVANEDIYTIAMAEKVERNNIKLRVIKKPQDEKFLLKDEVVLFSDNNRFLATVVSC